MGRLPRREVRESRVHRAAFYLSGKPVYRLEHTGGRLRSGCWTGCLLAVWGREVRRRRCRGRAADAASGFLWAGRALGRILALLLGVTDSMGASGTDIARGVRVGSRRSCANRNHALRHGRHATPPELLRDRRCLGQDGWRTTPGARRLVRDAQGRAPGARAGARAGAPSAPRRRCSSAVSL
jgi:hypothetical protein